MPRSPGASTTAWTSSISTSPNAAGRVAAALGAAAGVADQRLRLLHRHALEGPARAGRERAAAVCARRVARGAVLQCAGAGGAQLDGGGAAGRGEAHIGCRLERDTAP